jgi:tetratricopeptide (TPR) repeat protein
MASMLNRIFLATLLLCSLRISVFAADDATATLIEKGHFKRAEVILKQRVQSNPNDARSYCELSKVDLAFQRWDDAIQHADKAVSLDDKSAENHVQLLDALGAKLGAPGTGMFQRVSLGRRFKSESAIALQKDPNNVTANEDMVQFYLQAPSFAGGDKKKADQAADHMVQVNPVQGYLLKIEIATQEKRTGDLEKLVQQAVNADAKNYDARVQAATYYLGQGGGSLEQGEEQAEQAVKLDADRVAGYSILAQVYVTEGRWKELDSVLVAAEKAVPDDLAPYYQSARIIVIGGQNQELERAEKYMRLYIAQPVEGNEPPLAAAHWRLGLILEKQGHRDLAKQEMQQAVKLDPEFEPAKVDLKRLQ